MRFISILLFGLFLLTPIACTSSIPAAPVGEHISGIIRYEGNAQSALTRPALQVVAAVEFPPNGIPHGLLVIERPDFGTGIQYDIANLPVYSYKVAANIVDLNNPQAEATQLPLGGYPDTCTLVLAPGQGLVQVVEDVPVTGIDIQLFDQGGMADPCFAALGSSP